MTRRQWNVKLKVMFAHVPKCAGHSIRPTLFPWLGYRVRVGHMTAAEFRDWKPEHYDDFFVFGFVRRPEDRLKSVYRYMRHRKRRPRQQCLAVRKCRDFGEFVDRLFTREAVQSWYILQPASHYLCDTDGRFLVDFVGHTAKMKEHFTQVCDRLGVEPIHLHRNASTGPEVGPYDERRLRTKIRTLWPLEHRIAEIALSQDGIARYEYVRP